MPLVIAITLLIIGLMLGWFPKSWTDFFYSPLGYWSALIFLGIAWFSGFVSMIQAIRQRKYNRQPRDF